MTSERRNVWKVIESQDLYDNIMNMNELERLTRLEAQASTADENEFDFLTDLVIIILFKSDTVRLTQCYHKFITVSIQSSKLIFHLFTTQ